MTIRSHESTAYGPVRHHYRLGVQLWTAQLLLALYACMVGNLFFDIPFGTIVDVVLPLQVFAPLIVVARFLVQCAVIEGFAESSGLVESLLAYLLSPFAAMLGYMAYAYFYERGPMDQSLFFAAFSHHVAGWLTHLAALAARLSIPQASNWVKAEIMRLYQPALAVIGLLLALKSFVQRRSASTMHGDVHTLEPQKGS